MEEKDRKPFNRRLWAFGTVVVCVFLVLGFNLWRLQIAEGSYYATKAQGNFMKLVSVTPMRGDITDSKGKLLVTSEPQFALRLDWMDLQKAKNANWKDVIKRLAGYIKPFWPNQAQSQDSIMEDILVMIQNKQWERYRPVTILSNVDPQLQAIIAEHQEELPGVSVEALPVRTYPKKTMSGQVLGYVQEIFQEEIEQFNKNPLAEKDGFKYAPGDLVGKMGIEKSYDYWLRGKEGVQQVEVDNNAKPVAKRLIQAPEPGKTLQLTIDGELQKVVEDELEKVVRDIQKNENPQAEVGAAVVINVKTGKILAMASRPFMDPNDLIGKISDETAERYFRSESAASFNRALSGIYAPGSTFKMITGMAALHAKLVTPNEYFADNKGALGPAAVQAQAVGEWGGNDFGPVNLFRGLAKSSNIYFQAIGRRVFDSNPELMKQIANEFGLGVLSGIDLPGEAKGIAPSAEWKKEQYTPYYDKLKEKKLAAIESDYSTKITQAPDEKNKQKLKKQMEDKKKEVDVWYKQMINEAVDWRLYDSFNNSIGQGYNTYSPLQLANYVATMVNGGNHMKPYVVDKIIDPVTGKAVFENKPQVLNRVSVSPETLDTIKKAMREVTRGEGTGSGLFYDVPEFTGGGKTGTAQIGSKNTISGDLYNGVFVAFAPYDDPQIAFAGVVEYGYHGSTSAGYVAKAAFMKYFGWKSTNND
ncbi:MAG: penicillin-binding protein 2 [Desulfitobacterium hafniense]|nr:penicillin-binding protein 2 [Desulfitobacterium hafniense]